MISENVKDGGTDMSDRCAWDPPLNQKWTKEKYNMVIYAGKQDHVSPHKWWRRDFTTWPMFI